VVSAHNSVDQSRRVEVDYFDSTACVPVVWLEIRQISTVPYEMFVSLVSIAVADILMFHALYPSLPRALRNVLI